MLETGYGSEKYKNHKETMARKMAKYLDSRDCRRNFILSHFEGKPDDTNYKPKAKCCDNCTRT